MIAVQRGKLGKQRHQVLFKLLPTFHMLLELSLLPSGHSHSAIPPPNPRVLRCSPPLGMPRIDTLSQLVQRCLCTSGCLSKPHLPVPSCSFGLHTQEAACPRQPRPPACHSRREVAPASLPCGCQARDPFTLLSLN